MRSPFEFRALSRESYRFLCIFFEALRTSKIYDVAYSKVDDEMKIVGDTGFPYEADEIVVLFRDYVIKRYSGKFNMATETEMRRVLPDLVAEMRTNKEG